MDVLIDLGGQMSGMLSKEVYILWVMNQVNGLCMALSGITWIAPHSVDEAIGIY